MSHTWPEVLSALVARSDLSAEQTAWAMGEILSGEASLQSLHDRALGTGEPTRVSGQQERLENLVARYIERAR